MVSCSKNDDSSENVVTITPKVIAVENFADKIINQSTSNKATNLINKASSLINTLYFDGISADISINKETETMSNFSMNQTANQHKGKNNAALNTSNTMISPSTYYRFMLFNNNQSSDDWRATWLIRGGTSNSVVLDGNTTYRWYAGSYNEETSLPSLDYNQTTMPIDDVTSEFMNASGTVITSAKNNYINFTFQRKTAALTFIFDARKMNSKITQISLSPVDKTILKGGTFDLVTNQIVSLKNPTISTLNDIKWKNYSSSTGDSVKVASFYTLGTTDITNFGIRLENLVLENFSDAQNPITYIYTNKQMQLPVTISPRPGQRNTFTITLNKL